MADWDWPTLRARFADDGVIVIPRAFDEADMRRVDEAFRWMVDHPGPGADPAGFRRAVDDYLEHERVEVERIGEFLDERGPFRKTE